MNNSFPALCIMPCLVLKCSASHFCSFGAYLVKRVFMLRKLCIIPYILCGILYVPTSSLSTCAVKYRQSTPLLEQQNKLGGGCGCMVVAMPTMLTVQTFQTLKFRGGGYMYMSRGALTVLYMYLYYMYLTLEPTVVGRLYMCTFCMHYKLWLNSAFLPVKYLHVCRRSVAAVNFTF